MENSKLKLSSREVFKNQISFSKKIQVRVLKGIEEIKTSLDKFKILNEDDKIFFFNEVNHYYQNLCSVIFHLRQVVIQIGHDDQGVRDLQNIITELNQIALHFQGSLDLETEKLKIQLKSILVEVGVEVIKLLKIIESENLHDYKQNVLDCQLDLVTSTEALKLYIQNSYLGPSELERLIHQVIEKLKNNLIEIKTGHEHLEDGFSHYTRHSFQNLQNILNYLQKRINTENFQNEVVECLRNADTNADELIKQLFEILCYDNPMTKMLDFIENIHTKVAKGSGELQNGLHAAMVKNIGKKDIENLKQFIIHILINGLNVMSAWNQNIEDAILNK